MSDEKELIQEPIEVVAEQLIEVGGTGSGLTEDEIRDLIRDETAELQPKYDEDLETEAKTVVSAINELNSKAGGGITKETDPTVPDWAKDPTKPTYNYDEIKNKPELIPASQKGTANGVATLDATGKVPQSQLPESSSGGLTEDEVRQIVEDETTDISEKADKNAEDIVSALAEAKAYTDAELAAFDFIKIVSTLPDPGLPNRIYLVPQPSRESTDFFVEYLWVNKGTEEIPVWAWEYVGTKQVEIDLTNYYTKAEVAEKYLEKKSSPVNPNTESVYVVHPTQGQMLLSTDSNGKSYYCIPKQREAGRLAVGTPSKSDEATPKSYVDDAIATAITGALQGDY